MSKVYIKYQIFLNKILVYNTKVWTKWLSDWLVGRWAGLLVGWLVETTADWSSRTI